MISTKSSGTSWRPSSGDALDERRVDRAVDLGYDLRDVAGGRRAGEGRERADQDERLHPIPVVDGDPLRDERTQRMADEDGGAMPVTSMNPIASAARSRGP